MALCIDIVIRQSQLFTENNTGYCNALVTCGSIRKLWTVAYKCLVGLKKISPIENLTIEEKTTIWETAKDIAADRLNKQDMIELCQSLYTLEYILNL